MLIICGPGFQFLINFKLIYFLDNDIDKAESEVQTPVLIWKSHTQFGIQETKKILHLVVQEFIRSFT